ncbi:MAG: PDZ domain-containing protein [Lentisphaerae bacterium]|nr:PDZ domain-containing protein [Lentisphaerota bacterium]
MNRMLMAATAGLALASGAWAKDVAYLGVATEPLDPMTGRHLGLGEGIGLAVAHIDERGVLGDKVEEGDILHKFNDQLLVSPEQLAILVRREKPGTKASLTVLSDGKSETVEVKLGSIDSAEVAPLQPQRPWGRPMMGPQLFPMPGPQAGGQDWRERMEEFQERMNRAHGAVPGPRAPADGDDDAAAPQPREGRPRVEIHSSATSVVSEMRDGVTVTLTQRDGTKTAKIEKDGKVVFDGPVNNEKELKKVPEEFRDRVGDMQDKVKVEIRTQESPAPAPHRGAGRKNVL